MSLSEEEIKKLKRYLIRTYNFNENDIKDVDIQEDTAVVKRYSALYDEIVTSNFRLTLNPKNKIVAVNGFKF